MPCPARSALFPCCRSILFHFHNCAALLASIRAFGGPLLPLTLCIECRTADTQQSGKKFNCKLTECFGRSFVILARLLFGMFGRSRIMRPLCSGGINYRAVVCTAYTRCRKLRGIRIADAMQFVLGSGLTLKIPL